MLEVRPELQPSWCWLASYPKSGNTWLRLFLSAYFFGNGKVDINKLAGPIHGDLNEKVYQAVCPHPLEELEPYECFVLRPAAMHWFKSKLGHDAFMKTHCSRAVVAGNEIIPEYLTRGAVYLIRDPRDVVLSFARHISEETEVAVRKMNTPTLFLKRERLYQYLGTWSYHVESWTKDVPFQVHVVKYEDMVANTYDVFADVIRFLTGDKEPTWDIFEKAIESTRLEALKKQEETNGFREAPDNGGKFFGIGYVGAWRDELPADLCKKIEIDHKEQMEKFGYL